MGRDGESRFGGCGRVKEGENSINKTLRIIILAICLATFAARFLTLTADFPAGMDWSADQYTDEGWYAGGAITHYVTGDWLVPGDLNTIINFPVLQLIESGYYRLFGLSLVSDRSLTLLFTAAMVVLSFLITRALAGETPAWLCAVLLSINFFLFGSSKVAILEIPMLTLVLLAIWWVVRSTKFAIWQAIVLGLIYSLALLTKASASFGLPVLLLLIWKRPGSPKSKVWASMTFLAGVGVLYGGYTLWALRTYPQDYLTYDLNSIAPRITWSLGYLVYTAARTVWNGKIIDPVMYFLTLVIVPCGLVLFRRYRQNTLVQICILWLVTHAAILMVRGYLPPRYYLPFVVPVTMLFSVLMTMGVKDIILPWTGKVPGVVKQITTHLAQVPEIFHRLPLALIAVVVVFNLVQLAGYLAFPKYTYISMVDDVQQRIRASGVTQPVLLGAIAQTMSIELHIPTVNTQYGTQSLAWKLNQYHPNFYVALGPESKVRAQVSQEYTVDLLATYHVFGDYYAGDPVYLYRLTPIAKTGLLVRSRDPDPLFSAP